MSTNIEELLRQLSDKISEVYDLDIAEEITDIYIDLVKRVNGSSKRYWKLVKTLAVIEKERDELRKELDEERIAKNSVMKSYELVSEVAKKMIDEEQQLREKAEKERDQAEYDREYYATQLMEYID